MIAPTGPTSRAADPETSRTAVPSTGHLSRLQDLVFGTFVDWQTFYDGRGMTDDELVARLPKHHGTTVKKRRSELSGAGLIVDSGHRRPTSTGRMAIVWQVPT